MSVIILSWVDKGTCEQHSVYWHQVSLHQAGVGWGFGTVIFKVHPFSFFKSLSHPISPVLKKRGKCTSLTLSNYTDQKKNSQQQSKTLKHCLFKIKMTSALDLYSGLLARNVPLHQQSIVYDQFCHCEICDQIC